MGTAYVRPRKACATSSSIDHGRAIFTRADHDRSPAEVKIPSLLDARFEALNLLGHEVAWATRSSEKLLSCARPAHMVDTTLQSRSPWGGRGRHPSCMLVDVTKAFIPSVQHDANGNERVRKTTKLSDARPMPRTICEEPHWSTAELANSRRIVSYRQRRVSPTRYCCSGIPCQTWRV